MKNIITKRKRNITLIFILTLGICLFILELGSTGLIDETPPLFAAAARSMHLTGDWLTPRVNGLPRFDKPPLIYWLMGGLYSIPNQISWDPLGTWAARLPSALSCLLMMLFIGETLLKFNFEDDKYPSRTAVVTALAFGLSPLVMIWSRIAVSDALLCSTLGISLLLQWRNYSRPGEIGWYWAWMVLGLAVLTKGPVAIVLMLMTLILFGVYQNNLTYLFKNIHAVKGFMITLIVSLPWYLIELIVEGKPFWDSFFGYHNFQRFTSVVNSHQEAWWFFLMILIVASLPFSPLLIIGLYQSLKLDNLKRRSRKDNFDLSLNNFAACWLISVFALFTFSATKLPSYWLPATPAAAILIGYSSSLLSKRGVLNNIGWWGSCILSLFLGVVFWLSPFWLNDVKDPEIPNFGPELIASFIAIRAAICFTIFASIGLFLVFRSKSGRVLLLQAPLFLFHLWVLFPMLRLADRLRQFPVRQSASLLLESQKKNEPLVMVGAMKPSMHFYTKQVIVYEGRSTAALVNLSERLKFEKRKSWVGRPINDRDGSPTALIVIDENTTKRSHWKGLKPELLGQFGIYKIWRIDRKILEERARRLIANQGVRPNWKIPRPERF
tara:strand:- start:15730 stop:17556 length:1827 start_codon:yes stop_codon:yes gene_type:complete